MCRETAFQKDRKGKGRDKVWVEIGLLADPSGPGGPIGTLPAGSPSRDESSRGKPEQGSASVRQGSMGPPRGDPKALITEEREAGRDDEAIAVLLNIGGYAAPPGAARWTGYMVKAFRGDTGGLA